MKQYLADREYPFTKEQIQRILNDFSINQLPQLKTYWNYFDGRPQIIHKQPTDIGKPCNKIVINYPADIVDNYQGYLAGIPISYTSDNAAALEKLMGILNYNDYVNEDNELLNNALIYGVSYEINYIDEEGTQRFKVLDSREVIPVYANDLNGELLYVIRFWKADLVGDNKEDYYIDVYDSINIRHFKSYNGFNTLQPLSEEPHHFNQVPITVFNLNRHNDSIFKKIMSLSDAYNTLLSAEVDDFEAFADAYLVLKGVTADEEELRAAKEQRCLILDPDADAEYLTKSINDTQIQNLLDNINDQIHKIAKSPDFNDDKFMAQSGIAMRYKLIGFENKASSIEAQMRKALQKRIELISSILKLTDFEEEELWRDIEIIFTRNLPENLVDIADMINKLRGVVSTESLLQQIPFIKDVNTEMDKLNAEKETSMTMYGFGKEEEDGVLAEEE